MPEPPAQAYARVHIMGPMAKDWVDDENLSREETLRRFNALNPQPTHGPEPLPGGAEVVSGPRTYTGVTTVTLEERIQASEVVRQFATR